MNYFGLFFTFMIPGVIVGALAVAAVVEERRIRARKAARRKAAQREAARGSLYICDLSKVA